MSSLLGSATLIGATLATGLTSGLFCAFAHSVTSLACLCIALAHSGRAA